jgi:hypothetical protein
MKHLLLKFTYSVELGAYLAYKGHFNRTNDLLIETIMWDEVHHREVCAGFLKELGSGPTKWFDIPFFLIGSSIKWLCKFCPLWSLDFVARLMEVFAVASYDQLSLKYPQYALKFHEMSDAEAEHAEFFRKRRGNDRILG